MDYTISENSQLVIDGDAFVQARGFSDQFAKMDVSRSGSNKHDEGGSKHYFNQEIMQKMIERFLLEKRISKRKLASALGVTADDVRRLVYSKKAYLRLIGKVNLPLIRLYCLTRWHQSVSGMMF
jgi:hypothetical protein